MDPVAQANLATGRWLVRVLRSLGVGHWVISPGSRSAPLALAAATEATDDLSVVVDERAAGFRALGWAKASGRPCALICTSGSALAHYFPAIIEASETGLPLVVLSADRPPELRSCHAGQTIDQVKLFGSYVRFHAELPVPGELALQPTALRALRELLSRALWYATAGFGSQAGGGPVHLNCPFREPLFAAGTLDVPGGSLPEWPPVHTAVRCGPLQLPERTVILSGALPGRMQEEVAQWAAAISQRHAWPVLADGVSPLRHRIADFPYLITHYDRMARGGSLNGLEPQAILQIGEPPVSKELRRWLSAMDLPAWQVGPGKPGMNPLLARQQILCPLLPQVDAPAAAESTFGAAWLATERSIEARLLAALERDHSLFEGDVHRLLLDWIAAETPVLYANSMSMRDAEWFAPASDKHLPVYAQRGANGIDGAISIARGIICAEGRPGILVCGDLAFLHDAGGMAGAAADPFPLLVVVMDNAGGGIFDYLPVAEAEAFSALFSAPQAVDWGALARAFGAHYSHCPDRASLLAALRAWPQQGFTVLHVPVDRHASVALHRTLLRL